ncbi:hypothetical protein EPH_0004420 [Eimeria praecox]|uniref:Uncharacterized protein n=1 Tax=Eimeria praecox TaxID=51316 RepID=U6G4Q1_9EIME|nr:hypothetical protein EPH_0004420 [Eimeria praecox]
MKPYRPLKPCAQNTQNCCVDDVLLRNGMYSQHLSGRQRQHVYPGERLPLLFQGLRMPRSSRYMHLLYTLYLCFLFVVLSSSEPSLGQSVSQGPLAFSVAHLNPTGRASRGPAHSPSSLKLVNIKDKASGSEEESSGSSRSIKSIPNSKPQRTPSLDPFSAAQMLNRENYKAQLTAKLHLRASRNLEDEDKGPATTGEAAATVAAATEPANSSRSTPYLHSSFVHSVGNSLLELGSKEATVGANSRGEEEVFLQVPARYSSVSVKPHFPMLPEFFMDDGEVKVIDEELGVKENPAADAASAPDAGGKVGAESVYPVASLVQASATAEESMKGSKTKNESQEEAEEEEDKEESEQASKAAPSEEERNQAKREEDKEESEQASKAAPSEEESVHTGREAAETTKQAPELPEEEPSKEEPKHKEPEVKEPVPPLAIPAAAKESAASEEEKASSKEPSSKTAPEEEEEEVQSLKESEQAAASSSASGKETEKEMEKETKKETEKEKEKAEETHKETPPPVQPPQKEKEEKEEEKEEEEESHKGTVVSKHPPPVQPLQKEKGEKKEAKGEEEESHKETVVSKPPVPAQKPQKGKEEEEKEKEKAAEARKKELAEKATKLANLQRMEGFG